MELTDSHVWAYAYTGNKVHAFHSDARYSQHVRAACNFRVARDKDILFWSRNTVASQDVCQSCLAKWQVANKSAAERACEAAGAPVGSQWVNPSKPRQIYTVSCHFMGMHGPAVSLNIWEPGYRGRVGDWGTAMGVKTLINNYTPEEN